MSKKSTVRNTAGQIVSMLDESNGGWIIRGGRVVNPDAYNEMLRKEADRKEAAKAIANPVEAPKEVQDMRAGIAPLPKVNIELAKSESVPTDRVGNLEKKVEGMEGKLDQILNALKK